MKTKSNVAWGLAALVAVSLGCVERKVLIRSDPPGAPVWVDEKPAGITPVDYSFVHYGRRRIKVGPIRDEKDRIAYAPIEREVEIKPPWYEKFPVDFFFEVLYPFRLVDEHEIEVTLKPAEELPPRFDAGRPEEIVREAEELRDKALVPAPELEQ